MSGQVSFPSVLEMFCLRFAGITGNIAHWLHFVAYFNFNYLYFFLHSSCLKKMVLKGYRVHPGEK